MNTALVRKAIIFSMERHKDQKRSVNDYPYIVHPISVFSIVKKYKESKNSEMLLCAALLHDILEDTDTTYEELVADYSKGIADLVLEVTNDSDQIDIHGKIGYMKQKMMNMTSYGLIIKLADNLDNLTDNPSVKQTKRYMEVIDYIEINRPLTKTHRSLIREIRESV